MKLDDSKQISSAVYVIKRKVRKGITIRKRHRKEKKKTKKKKKNKAKHNNTASIIVFK